MKTKGARSLRSYLAGDVLERLGIEPIEELIKLIKEYEVVKKSALEAYQAHRGHGEKSDAGPSYLAQANGAMKNQSDILVALARFKYPVLAAVAVKEVKDNEEQKLTERVVNAAEVRSTILNDPMAPLPVLAVGKKEE